MIEVLLNIWHFIQSVGGWVSYALDCVFNFISQIPFAVKGITSVVNEYIPAFLLPFIFATIAISIIFKIINR